MTMTMVQKKKAGPKKNNTRVIESSKSKTPYVVSPADSNPMKYKAFYLSGGFCCGRFRRAHSRCWGP